MRECFVSFTKKSIALILTFLLLFSSFSIVTTIQSSAKDDATKDEAKKSGTVDVSSLYPCLIADDSRKPLTIDKKKYFEKKDLTTIYYVFQTNGTAVSDLAAYFYKADESEKKLEDSEGFELKANSLGYAVLILKLNKIYPSGIDDTEYKIVIKNKNNNSKVTETGFTIVDVPKIKDISYKNDSDKNWINKNERVSFKVDNPIIDTVEVVKKGSSDKVELTKTSGTYSFETVESSAYTIKAKDKFEQEASKDTADLKIDTNSPVIIGNDVEIKKGDNAYDGNWTNQNLNVSIKLQDTESGVKEASVKKSGNTTVESALNSSSNGEYVISFTADSNDDYAITFKDNAGNSGEFTVNKEKLLVDKQKPTADNCTVTFSENQSDMDSALRVLSFGLYDHRSVKLTVKFEENGGSPIKDITIYDGDVSLNKIDGEEGSYELPVKDYDTNEASKYNLYIQATDYAGNTSEKFSIADTTVKVKNKDDILSTFSSPESKKEFEVLLNDLVTPQFGEVSADPADGSVVSPKSEIKVSVSEDVSGLHSVCAFFGKKGEDGTAIGETQKTFSDKKETTHEISLKIPENCETGEYTVKFFAENNCGKTNELSINYKVDSDNPELKDNKFTYSNNNNQDWTKENVDVSFDVSDATGIKSVFVKKGDSETELTSSDNKFSFTAEENGKYEVIVIDTVGNESKFTTEYIKIDKENPVAEDFSYENSANENWTNKEVTISFKVKDNPTDQNSGVDSVSVDGVDEVSFNAETGECSFKANRYGKFKVTVTDKIGNQSEVETATVLYDDAKPEIDSVSFADFDTQRDYGTYSNKAITMTVAIKDTGSNPSGFSDSSVVVKDKNTSAAIGVNSTENENTVWNYVIESSDKVKNLTFKVTDKAGNSNEYRLVSEAIAVLLDESLEEKDYEVLSTLATAQINDFSVVGDFSTFEDYSVCRGEKGLIKTTIVDNLVGIKSAEVKFGKIGMNDSITDYENEYDNKTASFKNVSGTALSEFDPSAQKVESVNVSYDTSDYKDKIETGRYILAVKAVNNAGNTIVRAFELNIDNTEPEINGIAISGNELSKYSNDGVYSSGDVKVTVSVDDTKNGSIPSSGIDDVKLFADGEQIASKKGTGSSGDIELTVPVANKIYKNITLSVTDKLGIEKSYNITELNTKINDEEITPTASFEIVAYNNSGNIINITDGTENENLFDGIRFDFDKVYKSNINKLYVRNDGTITGEFKDEIAGLDSVEFYIQKSGEENIKVPEDNGVIAVTSEKTGNKINSFKVVFDSAKFSDKYQDASGIKDGEYKVKFVVKNNCNSVKNYTKSFVIDKTAPVIKSIKFIPKDTNAVEAILNVLTFGLYENKNIIVETTVEDSAPSSSVASDDIELSTGKGFKVVAKDITKQNNTYTKKFELYVSDDPENSNYNDLFISVKDKLENASSGKYNLFDHYFNNEKKNVDDDFDIILNNNKESIVIDTEYDKDNEKDTVNDGFLFENFAHYQDNIFSDVNKNIAKVSAKFKDELSGLKDITATISKDNGEAQNIEVNVSDNLKQSKVKETIASVNLSNFGVDTGEYELVFSVTNNIGLNHQFRNKFKIDESAPEMMSIDFTPQNSDTDNLFSILTFGLFSNCTVKASLTFKDIEPSAGVDFKDVKLTSEKGYKIEPMSDGYSSETSGDGYKYYTKDFLISVGNAEGNSNYKDMIIDITDKFNNHYSSEYYGTKTVSGGKDVPSDADYDVIINNTNTTIKLDEEWDKSVSEDVDKDGFAFKGYKSIIDGDKFVVSDKDSSSSYISVKFIDNLSGIKSVKAYISKNGSDKKEVAITLNPKIVDEKGGKIKDIIAKYDTNGVFDSADYEITFVVTNNIGLKNTFTKKFGVDKTVPEIDKIRFIPIKDEGTDVEDFFKAITFGLFSQDKVQVEVTISDKSPSSTINDEDIKLESKAGNSITVAEKTKRTGDTYVKVFELAEGNDTISNNSGDSNYKDVVISVRDRFGNEYSAPYYDSNGKVFVNDTNANVNEVYDIVVNGKDTISQNKQYGEQDGFKFENFDFYDTESSTYKDGKDNPATISAEFSDLVSGIQDVEVFLNDANSEQAINVSNYVEIKDLNDNIIDLSKERVTNVRAVFNATERGLESSGLYNIEFKVKNNANKVKSFKTKFNIDKTEPELFSVQFSQSSNLADRFLNFLSFGLYSNDDIEVTVIARDANPSAYLNYESIVFYLDKANAKYVDGSFTQIPYYEENNQNTIKALFNVNDKDDENYVYFQSKFILSSTVEHCNYKGFSFKTTDNADNAESTIYYGAKYIVIGDKKDASGKFDYAYRTDVDKNKAIFNDLFDILAANDSHDSPKRPKVTDSSVSKVTNSQYTNNSKHWYSGDVKYKFSITDKNNNSNSPNVTLKQFKVYLKSDKSGTTKDVTKYCKIEKAETLDGGVNADGVENGVIDELNNVFASSHKVLESGEDLKVNNITVSVDTSSFDQGDKPEFGKNKFTVKAYGNNNSSYPDSEDDDKSEQVFYFDDQAPVITKFEFDGDTEKGNAKTGSLSTSEKKAEMSFNEVDYTYFFRNETQVTVTASDVYQSINGCGVNTICFKTIPAGKSNSATGYGVGYESKKVNDNNSATFTIPANFKGRIFAYAEDHLNNMGKDYSPNDAIVENKSNHNKNTKLTITPDKTSVKDAKGRPLYSKNVSVKLSATTSYAGIYSVDYRVTSPMDSGKNQSGHKSISLNGNFSGGNSGWVKENTERNLVTKISKTIKVSNNSNDIVIWLKVTDRTGFSSETSKRISIDKTAPKIKVKFSCAHAGNRVEGVTYYNKTRTANITVTERNFDPAKFIATIKNTYKSYVPRVVAGANWKSPKMNERNQDGTTHNAKIVFDKDGDYSFNLKVTDKIGNKGNEVNEKKFTIDKVKPVINISFDKNRSTPYYNQTRTATITITEHNFLKSYAKVDISAYRADNTTPGGAPPVVGYSKSGDKNTATITFSNDGKYKFTVNFKDRAENVAEKKDAPVFYIDKHAGKIEFREVENDRAYGKGISPRIIYTDPNIDSKNSVKITKTYVDEKTKKFITNDNAYLPYSHSSSGTSFTNIFSNIPVEPNYDGIYTLKAEMTDKAGNSFTKSITFSVNRFGSTFIYGDKKTEELLAKKGITNNTPDLVILEYNVNKVKNQKVKVSRDGNTKELSNSDYSVNRIDRGSSGNGCYKYRYVIKGSNFEKEGNYTAIISSVDALNRVISNKTAYKSGNADKVKIDRTCPVSFLVDKTKPTVTISGIETNEFYEDASRKVKIICDDSNLVAKKLKIYFDGKEIKLNKSDIITDLGSVEVNLNLEAGGNNGDREFKVVIEDRAGNVTEQVIKPFRLSASWLARLLHYHLPLVIIIGVVLIMLIAGAIVLAKKKRNREIGDK